MSLKGQLDLIRDTFSNDLPGLLSTAGLDDFEAYLSTPDNNSQQRQLCVYPDMDSNVTDDSSRVFIIKAQLYRVSDSASYFDVITPFIRENLTPELLGFTNRMSITTDFYPIDLSTRTSFIFYSIMFSNELDDCEV